MFRINGVEWDVLYVDSYSPYLERSDGSLTLGVTDYNTKTIYLNKTLKGNLLKRVLTHEICHAEVFSRNIKDFSLEQEELVCEFVSQFGDEIFEIADMIFDMKCLQKSHFSATL